MGWDDFSSRWRGFWGKHDPDNVFSYDTFKMVTIRDRYLGFLHHSLQLGILLYIVVYVIFIQKEFLKLEDAIGIVRLSVKNTSNLADYIDPGTEAYCDTPPANTGKPICIFPPIDQISDGSGQSIFISTHVYKTDYSASCDPDLRDCHPLPVNGTREYFVANLMDLNVSLDHSVQVDFEGQAPLGHLQWLKDPGALGDPEWADCRDCAPNRFQSLSADNIPLEALLRAARLNLDATANDYLKDLPEYTGPADFRSFGAVLLLQVVYENRQHYFRGSPPIKYYYQPRLITNIDDYLTESVYTAYPYNRTVIYRKGLHIIGIIAGELGHFTFQTLLIQLTTSLALMKVATTAVDLIAINILPAKILYRKAKYEKTEDFSDLKRKQNRVDVLHDNGYPIEMMESKDSVTRPD